MKNEDIKNISVQEILKKLSCNKDGLSEQEAKKRLEQYGYNQIEEKKTNPVLKFLSYFWGPIAWMIEVAAILSITIKHWEDFWIILTLLLLNAIVAFWQESKAGSAIEALKKKLAPEAKVKRNGKWVKIEGRELVPGDIVRVRSGDIIPADIKFIEGDFATIDESALTGESMPVDKHESDIGYNGSVLKQGEMNGVVVSTGMNTYFGKTAKLVEDVKTKSHFQKAVIKIANYLIFMAVILVVIISLVGIYRGESILQLLQFALVLTVASIPVALPAVLSVTLAVGAMALAAKNAIVSKLTSIEEMAGMDVLCSDKTGTITENKIIVTEIISIGNFKNEDVIRYACMSSKEENQDAIDNAIFKKAEQLNELKDFKSQFSIKKFKPFDPVSKRTEAIIEMSGQTFKVSKGATQTVMELVKEKSELAKKVDQYILDFAKKGYRALAIAKAVKADEWVLVGLLAMEDPPREDSAETIKSAQNMGIVLKMLTGDRVEIAKNIALQVNLKDNIIKSDAIRDKSDSEAAKVLENADGFAEVFPEDKYHIVEVLQNNGHIVGMTGDGVNDAPALKKADVGIAVEGATDAATSAAAIVFTTPGLSTIIDAVKRSREIFQRMTHYSIYRITETIRILLFVSLSIIVFNFYPVTALMIVLLALLNDAPIMTIAYDNVTYSKTPDKWNMKQIMAVASFLGVIGVVVSFGILYIGRDVFNLSNDVLQSFIYLKLSVFGHFTVFITRTKGHFWKSRPALPLLFAVVITQIIATLITVYGILLPAMGWKLAGFIWGCGIVVFMITDFLKVYLYKLTDHRDIKLKRLEVRS